MDEGQFLTAKELREIADLCDFLNGDDAMTEIGLGTAELYDANGEVCGYLSIGSPGYALYFRKPTEG